ncbi:MAG TPA: stimulus-sensing domain-containing protein [Rhodopila sp.]|uniref:stimulus-sensing domain-containing protein n=1 Tax=Rhodopila sp. TaxID=2480087 RepID=UPI002D198E2B|nr:stimulus-sensing domain-containing protein [Rhodopila sp.]HVY15301.1 stimulus-sensing domain-containing protein [Rhodopila sp.]
MPDGFFFSGLTARRDLRHLRQRWVSPLLRRILLVNALPLALLVVALLYLDQYQNGLLEAQVTALREQARVFAGALGESAVRTTDPDVPRLIAPVAASLLRRLTEPTPDAEAKLYAPDGTVLADSRQREGPSGTITTEPLPPPVDHGPFFRAVGSIYDWVLALLPHQASNTLVDLTPGAGGADWQPDVKEELRLNSAGNSRETAPYIRRTRDNRLLVTVAVPVERDKHTVGIVSLTREAREVDQSLYTVRMSILALFGLALALTVLLSWYLSLTIARPILRLAEAAADMREGHGRSGSVPAFLLRRRDEIGALASALSDSAAALWERMDATERFAADVAHEIKNPLSSIRSAIETLLRIEDIDRQRQLLTIIGQDVVRLDRLISDVSDASRLDAEMSRVSAGPVDVVPILRTLQELDEATRDDDDPRLEVVAPPGGVTVWAVEDRLVQVLRNLIGNAQSFSPPRGRIVARVRDLGLMAELSVEDEGPGIPDAKLEHIFDRFYSERPKNESFGHHSGLGLSISRQIVEALQGQISAENRRDAKGKVLGARFIVRLRKA